MRIFSAIYLLKLFHQVEPSGLIFLLFPDQSSGSTQQVMLPSFIGLYSISHAIEFYYNSNAAYHQRPRYKICQSNQIKFLSHQIFYQLSLMVNTLEQHWYYQLLLQQNQTNIRKQCFAMSSIPYILALSQKFLGYNTYVSKKSHVFLTQAPSQVGSTLQAFINYKAP